MDEEDMRKILEGIGERRGREEKGKRKGSERVERKRWRGNKRGGEKINIRGME